MRKNYFLSLFLLMIAFWKVEAKERENSTENAPSSITIPGPATLPTPTELNKNFVGGTGTRLNLFWRDNASDETSFQVAISTDGVNFGTVNADATLGLYGNIQLTNLQPGTQYWFAVRAVKAGAGPTTFVGCTTSITTVTEDPADLYSCWSNIITVTTNPNRPNPPSNAVVSTYAQRKATLVFTDTSNDEQGFLIQRSFEGGPFVDLATIPASPGVGSRVQFVDTGLQPELLYEYRVFSFNVTDYSIIGANSGLFRTLPDPPSAPQLLQSPNQTISTIDLLWWDTSTNEQYFVIERSTDRNFWAVLTDTWFANTGYFTDKNLLEGVTYYYRVKATNAGGSSAYSNILTIATKKRVAPPSPYDLAATPKAPTRIDLNWSNRIYGEYDVPKTTEIYRSEVSATDGFLPIGYIPAQYYTYIDSTTKAKTKYWYKVITTNEFGRSDYSNVVAVTSLGAPYAPSNLMATAAKDSLGRDIMSVNWTDNSDDEDYFTLERATDVNFTTNLLTANLVANYTSAVSIPFEEGVTYFFRIKATNKYGDSKYSEVTSITTFYTAVPNKPFGLKASATATAVTLKWLDDSNKEESFDIERSTNGTDFTKIGSTNRNVLTYVDNTVAAKTKYYYRVKSVNPKGSSVASDVATITTPAATSGFISTDIAAADNWQVFPNPTADAVKVVLPESMQNQVGVVTIIDRMNREVFRTALDANQTEYRFDLSNFTEGTYTISIRTSTKQITKRVYKY